MTNADNLSFVNIYAIFNQKDAQTFVCNNCLHTRSLTNLVGHKNLLFCNKDCFLVLFCNTDIFLYKKCFFVPSHITTEKLYIVYHYIWDYHNS